MDEVRLPALNVGQILVKIVKTLQNRVDFNARRVLLARLGADFLRQNREWLLEDALPVGPVAISLR